MTDKPVTTKCWCLSCDPKSGEIGLECKNLKTINHQRFMAALLGLNTNEESSWPMDTINNLIYIDNEKGRKAVLKEIHEMLTPPPKSNCEIIADLVVEKLIARGIRL